MFSTRLDWATRPNPISELLGEKRRRGERVLDLTESNPTQAGIEYPAEAIASAFATARALRYDPEPFGLNEGRIAVAGYYAGAGLRIDPARIVLTASTSEAYAYLFKLLTDPGDEILTPRPSYPLFEYLAKLESVRAVQYPLFYDHGWHLDGAALRALITPRTRAIVTVHPNNPTGSYLKRHELAEMIALAQEHELAIISDEVFSDYSLDEDPDRAGVVADQTEAVAFSLSGLSKIVGLPQMKLGWMVAGGPAPLRAAALERLEFIADTYLSAGTPVQLAAGALLEARRDVQRQIGARLTANLAALRSVIAAASHVRLLEVEGGWYASLQVPRLRSEEEWTLALLRDHNVLVQPGFFYDFGTEAFLVISLLTRPDIFVEGLSRLADLLAESA
jgi:aspartate/methionine/tyrosine aminotransferase